MMPAEIEGGGEGKWVGGREGNVGNAEDGDKLQGGIEGASCKHFSTQCVEW